MATEMNEKALLGRINSQYSYKTVNDQGVVTIEANIVVRDQSFEQASTALLGVMKGIAGPAEAQVKQ